MSQEEGLEEFRPIHEDVGATVQPYVELFARQVVALSPEDDWYQPWSAYTLAVLLHADASGETTVQELNQAYSDGLNTARVERGQEPRIHRQFSNRQWQFFRRVVFGGIESAGEQPTVDIKPEGLLAGIVAGTYRHQSLLGTHNPS